MNWDHVCKSHQDVHQGPVGHSGVWGKCTNRALVWCVGQNRSHALLVLKDKVDFNDLKTIVFK